MPSPLHPAVVHFPIVLAVLLPFLAAAALLVTRRATRGRGAWLAVAAFSVLLALSALAAVATGRQQEEAVERVVAEGVLHAHEEAAEGLLAGSASLAVVVLIGLVRGRVGQGARYLSVAVALGVLALAFRAGGSGGELVYTHGAASAYLQGSTTQARSALPTEPRDDDDEAAERSQRDRR